MKAITAQYTAEELITKRSAVGEEIGATLAEKVQEYGILIVPAAVPAVQV